LETNIQDKSKTIDIESEESIPMPCFSIQVSRRHLAIITACGTASRINCNCIAAALPIRLINSVTNGRRGVLDLPRIERAACPAAANGQNRIGDSTVVKCTTMENILELNRQKSRPTFFSHPLSD